MAGTEDRVVKLLLDVGLRYSGHNQAATITRDLMMIQSHLSALNSGGSSGSFNNHWASGVNDPRLASQVPTPQSRIPTSGDIRLADTYGVAGGAPGSSGLAGAIGDVPAAGILGVFGAMYAGAAGAAGLGFYYGDFEKQTQRVAANSNMAAKYVDDYRNALLKLLTDVPLKWQDSNQVFYHLFNLGWAGAGQKGFGQTYGAAKVIDMLSLATGGDPTSITNALGGAINAFGIPRTAGNALSVSDLLHGAAVRGNVQDVGQIAQYLPQVTAFAGAAGGPAGPMGNLNSALEIVATLTRLGTPIAKAVTQAGDLYQHIIHPSKSGETFLTGLYNDPANPYQKRLYGDFSSQGVAQVGMPGILSDIKNAHLNPEQLLQLFPGYRGGRGILQLMTSQGYGMLQQDIAYGPGAGQGQTRQQYEEWTKTLNGRMTILGANFSKVALLIGRDVEPHLKNFISDLSGMLGGLGSFLSQNKQFTSTLVEAGVQFFRFATGIGEYQVFFGSILPAGIKAFEVTWQTIESIWKIVGSAMETAGQTVSGWWKQVTTAASTVRSDIASAATTVINSIKTPFDVIASVVSAIKSSFDAFGLNISQVFDTVKPTIQFIQQAWQYIVETLKTIPVIGGFIADPNGGSNGATLPPDIGSGSSNLAGLANFYGTIGPKGGPPSVGSKYGVPADIAAKYPNIVQWWPDILAVSKKTGVPPYVIAAYMSGESGGNPTAVSSTGAYGLMQIEPGTEPQYNRYDPLQNIMAGATLIKSGEQNYGQNWAAIYANVYNPGVSSGDGGYQQVIGNLGSWGGTGGNSGVPDYSNLPTPPGTGPDATGKPLPPSYYLKGSQIPGDIGWVRAAAAKHGIPVQLLEAVILQNYGGKIQSFGQLDNIAGTIQRDLKSQGGDWNSALAEFVHGGAGWQKDPLASTTSDSILSMAGNLGLTHLPGVTKTPQQIQAAALGHTDAGLFRVAASLNRVWNGIDPTTLPIHGNNGLNQTNWLKDQLNWDATMRKIYDNQALQAYLLGEINKTQYKQILQRDKQWQQGQDQKRRDALHGGGPYGGILSERVAGPTSCEAFAQQNVIHRHVNQAVAAAGKSMAVAATNAGEAVKELRNINRRLDRNYTHSRRVAKKVTGGQTTSGNLHRYGVRSIAGPGF